MLSRQFLVQMAHDRELSPEQEEVFLLRFAEDVDYEAIAHQLQTSEGACLKRMGEVYKKFGISGVTRGKENRLRIFLLQELDRGATRGLMEEKQVPIPQRRVFISYRPQEPDKSLARELGDALDAANCKVFMAQENIDRGENWPQRLDAELRQSDYLVLLWSPQSAYSDLVIEEIERARELRSLYNKPEILAVCIDYPLLSLALNYDLRSYLQGVQQLEWRSPADTNAIVQAVVRLVINNQTETIALAENSTNTEKTANSSVSATKSVANRTSSLSSIRGEENSSFILYPSSFPTEGRPLPVAVPELPEGQVDLASAFYVDRPPIELRCYETILQPGSLIRIKAPRQMGKTSLMARILHQAAASGYRTVTLNFQLADRKIFANLDQLLQWFCAYVGLELQLPNRLSDYWDDIFGSKVNCKAYFEKYLLAEIPSPLVLGLDEVDRVFQHPEIADDFFGLLRAWHEEAKKRDIWKKLRLVVVHSTEIYIPLDINQSPFNVGLPIELSEFSNEQVRDLARRYGLNWSASQVEQLMAIVGGHPFLVRLALYHVARQDTTLEQLLQTAPTEAGLYGDHLRRHLWNLQQHPELAAAMMEVVATTNPVRLEAVQAFKLHSMGLVNMQGNEVTPRCDLYRRYFRLRLS